MMSKICVVQAPFPENETDSLITLGLGTLSGGLKRKGIEFEQVNLNYHINSDLNNIARKEFDSEKILDKELNRKFILGKDDSLRQEFLELIEESGLSDFDKFFISVSSAGQLLTVLSLSKVLKEINEESIVVIGGAYTNETFERWDVFPAKFPFVDFVFTGFIENVDIGPGFSRSDLKDTRGFSYFENGEFKIKDVVDVPIEDEVKPFWSSKTVEECRKVSSGSDFVLMYRTSRRCGNGCSFCTYRKPYRHKSLEKIREELSDLKEEYGTEKVFLCDANLGFDTEFLGKFAEIAGDLGLRWGGNSQFIMEDESFYRKLGENGCKFLIHGLESGSEEILNSMGKPFRPDQAERCMEKESVNGIKSVNHLIVGFPGETDQKFRKTCRFLRKNFSNIYDVILHQFALCEDTYMIENPESFGIKVTEDLEEFELENTSLENFLNEKIGHNRVEYSENGKKYPEITRDKKRRYLKLFYRFKTLLAARRALFQNEISKFSIFFKKPYLRFASDIEDLFV